MLFRSANGELSYVPDLSALVPSVAQAQQGTLSGVFGDRANPTTEKALSPLEVEKGKKGASSSMEAGGDWVPKGFGAVDKDARDAAAGPYSSMQNGGDAIPKSCRFASSSLAADARRRETGEENHDVLSGSVAAAIAVTVEDSLFFTEADDDAMAQSQLREEVTLEASATTPVRFEEGLFFTQEHYAEMAQSVPLKEVEVGEKAAATYGVNTTRDGTPAGLNRALNNDAGDGDEDAGVDRMDELEAEMNAAFVKELAGDGDDDGKVVDEAQPERNGNGWLR